MKKSVLFTLLAAHFVLKIQAQQNVGIGTAAPISKLHVRTGTDSLILLENTRALGAGISNSIHFKTSVPYTGAIKTIGLGPTDARMGFYTGASTLASGLQERVSILNNGFVGIGATNPTTRLQIGDYGTNPNDTYLTIKTVGGGQYKAGVGLYHFNDNYGWLMESDEISQKFSIRHRNGQVFNSPAFTIDGSERVGIGSVNPTTKLQVGDYSNAFDNYITVKTAGGLLHKAGLGLYHYSDNYGWLLESDETTSSFSIRHRNSLVFNNAALTIDQFDNIGIGRTPYDDTRFTVGAGYNTYGMVVDGLNAFGAGFVSLGKSVFSTGTKQVLVTGTASGGPTNAFNSYPLLVEGGQQGIAVHINSDAAHEGNNYMYFADNTRVQGSIVAQNVTELHNSFDYAWTHSMFVLEEAFIAAEGIACGVQLDAGEAIVMGLQGALIYAQWAEQFANMENSVGVVYQSNAADYAEWLERNDVNEQLEPGMIVGVKGGRVSKLTSGSKSLMVISTAPLVLGNTPPEGRQSAFEKVAFMGQVPVRVRGKANVGDYILASGQNDGMGIAVPPSKMQLEDYDKVVGVAWSASISDNGESLINTAVGLNTNDLVGEIKQQKTEVQQLKETLQGVMAYLKEKDPGFKLSMPASQSSYAAASSPVAPAQLPQLQPKKPTSPSNLNQLYEILKNNPIVVDEMLNRAKEICISRGIDVNKVLVKELFDRDKFYQRLEKTIYHKVQPRKTMVPVISEQDLRRFESISEKK